MASIKAEIRLVFVNEKAHKALAVAADAIGDIAEDMPWRPEARRAQKALLYALKHIAVAGDDVIQSIVE